jgi:hypothetical protein
MTTTTDAPARVQTATQPTVEIVTITPEMARGFLELNTTNRPLAEHRVVTFQRDIENGAWRLTGEAVKFDTSGNLLDGQHRLWAVVNADKPITTFVVTGLEPETQEVMDTGQKRTMGQVLGLRGIINPNVVAAVAILMIQWEQGDRFRDVGTTRTSRMVSHTDISRTLDENPDIIDAVAFAVARRIPGITVSVEAFALTLLRRVNKDEADAFMADLATMRTSGAGDPRAALLKRLANARDAHEPIDRYTQAIILIRTWNAVRKGEEQFRVQTRVRGQAIDAEDPI